MPLILPKEGLFELEEKRSRFIGRCAPVGTEADARQFIESIRAIEKGANHNVFAYSVTEGNIIRFNDDGEPGGTAGMPVLNVLDKAGVINWVCVVTRYFGGTLLGAGGLVRAYTKAAKGAMDDAGPIKQVFSKLYRVVCEYPQFDNVKYNFDKWELGIVDIEYTDKCTLYVQVKDELAGPFLEGTFYKREEIWAGQVVGDAEALAIINNTYKQR
ncbi:MAG: YigZ family protein [Defluviitaleaceae bacterium]|nr:YigZ family protein [Defluviitaleaceae bacterium]